MDALEAFLNAAFWIVIAIVPIAAGCSFMNTRPGHPDSWCNKYYDSSKEWHTSKGAGPSSCSDSNSSTAASTAAAPPAASGASAASAKPASAPGAGSPTYLVARTPVEIWQARGYAYNMHLRYEAASYKAQDRQDALALPIIGAAVGTAAAAIAGANPYILAGTALGGAAVGAGAAYLQPGSDAKADISADSALLCIVDVSNVLTNLTAIPLALDKAALQDALTQLRLDTGALSSGKNGLDQTVLTTIATVEEAGDNVIQQLDAAISQYVMFPALIYQTTDRVDIAARTGGARSLDYASALQNLQASLTTQTNAAEAKKQVQAATTEAAKTPHKKSPTPAAAASATGASAPSAASSGAAPTLLVEAQKTVNSVASAAAAQQPASTPSIAGQPPLDATNKADTLTNILGSPALTDMTRVTVLSKAALNDLPVPDFPTIAAGIQKCWPLN